jgi:hypothetical protein
MIPAEEDRFRCALSDMELVLIVAAILLLLHSVHEQCSTLVCVSFVVCCATAVEFIYGKPGKDFRKRPINLLTFLFLCFVEILDGLPACQW